MIKEQLHLIECEEPYPTPTSGKQLRWSDVHKDDTS